MVTTRGKAEVKRFMAQLPAQIEERVLRGAARAAANVIADEARRRSESHEVSAAVKVATRKEPGRMVGKVQVKGPGDYIAPWLEYGTDPHFISVDDSQREGRSIGRINRQLRENDGATSLVINGKFVGTTVFHPGARPHPFLRPALDTKEAEAVAAAQAYINSRIAPGGIVGVDDDGDDA